MKKRHVPILLLAQSVMHGCGAPGDEIPAPQAPVQVVSAAVEVEGTEWDRLVKASKMAAQWSGYYAGAMTAIDVGQQLLKALGIINPKVVDDQFVTLRNELAELISQATAAEIMVEVDQQRNVLREAMNSLIQFDRDRQRGLATIEGFRPWFRDNYDVRTREALGTLTLLKSARPHRPFPKGDGIDWGKTEGDRLTVDEHGNVYDWRIVVPALLEGIAYRMQIIAFLEPEFRTSRRTDVEFEKLRDSLGRHYELLTRVVRCGSVRAGTFGLSGCRDWASGRSETTGGSSTDWVGMTSRLMQQTPIFEVRRVMDQLALMITGHPDVSGLEGGIAPWHSPNLCLTAKDTISNSATVLQSCSPNNPSQRWLYDRAKGSILHTQTGMCLEPLSGGAWESVGGTDLDHPLRLVDPRHPGRGARVGLFRCEEQRNAAGELLAINRQSWTWDPWTGQFQNGMGPYFWPPGTVPSSDRMELGSALDVESGLLEEGRPVQIYTRSNGKVNQAWGIFDLVRSAFFPASMEVGIDRPGRDLRTTRQTDAVACRAWCSTSPACRAFTFLRRDPAGGDCWLKIAVPPAQVDGRKNHGTNTPAIVSGIVNPGFEPGSDRFGSDYSNFTATAAACRTACLNDNNCKAFTFFSGTCSLKSGVPAPTALQGASSGVRIGNELY